MIYLLYGEDSFRSWHKLQNIKAKYLDASMGDTDLSTLDGSGLTADEFRRQVQTLPFLAKSRLVIIKNLIKDGKKDVQEGIQIELGKVPKTTVLFFYEAGTVDKRNSLFKTLNQPKQAQEYPLLVGPELAQYVAKLAKEEGLNLSPALAQQLVGLTGSDLWRVHQEIEKLRLYKLHAESDATKVTQTDLELLVGGSPEARIFDLTDALGERKSKVAVSLLQRLADEENDLGLLAMIAGHYRNLLLIAEGQARHVARPQLAAELKLHPFVFDKVTAQARNYTYDELVACYRYLYQLDLLAKQSVIEPKVGLTVLAAQLEQKPLRLPDLTEETMIQ